MFGTLDNPAIEALLHRAPVGRIGCHAEGITYIIPISYAYDGNYLFAHSFEGLKMNIMRKNPRICFQVDDFHDLANWQSVVAWGDFEELAGGKERSDAVNVLMSRHLPFVHSATMQLSSQWPFPSSDPAAVKGIIFRIRLAEKSGRFEKSTADQFFAS